MLPVTTLRVPIPAVPPPATAGVGALEVVECALALDDDDDLEDMLNSNCHEINNKSVRIINYMSSK